MLDYHHEVLGRDQLTCEIDFGFECQILIRSSRQIWAFMLEGCNELHGELFPLRQGAQVLQLALPDREAIVGFGHGEGMHLNCEFDSMRYSES